MAQAFLNEVRRTLQGYADRGVFRGFCEVRRAQFNFVWLTPGPLELSVDASKQSLRFKHLLPGIPADSALYATLKRFVRERHDGGLPAHRRIDPGRAEVSCSNRRGFVTISLRVRNHEYSYGVSRIVN
ncbi:MAG TPA: hypothetical protein VFV34_26205, partial [Blastocatellia bacterium]|nr:hypothetical protein [Blastocatellia bacterium]